MGERVLVTGAGGFLGSALERCARDAGHPCLGLGRTPRDRPDYVAVDLTAGPDPVVPVLEGWRPDVVFHLAGGAAAGDPFTANVATTRSLLQALPRVGGPPPRVVVVGSAAEYGDLGPEPVTEDARERPVSEYGVAKLAQTRLALVFRRAGARVVVARPFNVMGPGMSAMLAPARFAREALAAAEEGREYITVGDLTTIRDYLDVEDVARALLLIGLRDVPHEIVNVCSGRPVATREILEEILRQIGGNLRARTDARLVKGPADVPVSVGCPDRLRALLGSDLAFSLPRAVSRLVAPLREHGAR